MNANKWVPGRKISVATAVGFAGVIAFYLLQRYAGQNFPPDFVAACEGLAIIVTGYLIPEADQQ